MSEHIRRSVSTQELTEEFDHILTKKRVKLDNLANLDRNIVEEFPNKEFCSSTPPLLNPSLSSVISGPPQMGHANKGPESWTRSGNKEDSESSVSDSMHKGGSEGMLTTKKEVLVNPDFDSLNDLREISRKDKKLESSVSIKKFLEEFNSTLQEEFENKVWTYKDNMGDLPKKKVLHLSPPLLPLHPPALPPNSGLPEFSVNANDPVQHNEDKDDVFRPPPPTFIPPAPSARLPLSRDPKSSISIKEMMEDADRFPGEKRVKLDNLANVDRNIVEEYPNKELCSPSPLSPKPSLSPVIQAPRQMGQSNKGPRRWMCSGNKEDSESSVSDRMHKGESDGILAPKKEVLVNPDCDSLNDLLRESSRKDKESETSVSIKKFLEEFNSALQEEFENKVWTYKDNMGHLPRKKVLHPCPPLLLLHPPALLPNSPLPEFSVNANDPVRHNKDQDDVFRPPPPTVPPPPSKDLTSSIYIHEIIEDVDRILVENFSNVVPTDWNVKEAFLPGNVLLLHPPPPIWLGPPQFHTDTLILHCLPIAHLPQGFKLEPIGVLNGEVLHGVVPPSPLDIGRRTSDFSTPTRVKDEPDDGRPYVKKPSNAFILFLKEQRPNVVSELNINRSAMVNTIVGEMWNSLPIEEKAKYFEKARLEKKLHQQQHPDWSNYDNYGKKKKRAKKKTSKQQQQQHDSLDSKMPFAFLCCIPDSCSEPDQDYQGPKAETDSGAGLFYL